MTQPGARRTLRAGKDIPGTQARGSSPVFIPLTASLPGRYPCLIHRQQAAEKPPQAEAVPVVNYLP